MGNPLGSIIPNDPAMQFSYVFGRSIWRNMKKYNVIRSIMVPNIGTISLKNSFNGMRSFTPMNSISVVIKPRNTHSDVKLGPKLPLRVASR
jgi:hypothetical protein